ncbi:MAG: hypothetical protein GDA43_17250 [Hormoscilla sp. SP5CHS1]|nr:hypothetical protein [Hormoscilla sp. SP5CHS1]
MTVCSPMGYDNKRLGNREMLVKAYRDTSASPLAAAIALKEGRCDRPLVAAATSAREG